MTLAPGERLGAYEILALIGAGGMSVCDHAEAVAERSHGEASASVRGGCGAPPPLNR